MSISRLHLRKNHHNFQKAVPMLAYQREGLQPNLACHDQALNHDGGGQNGTT